METSAWRARAVRFGVRMRLSLRADGDVLATSAMGHLSTVISVKSRCPCKGSELGEAWLGDLLALALA